MKSMISAIVAGAVLMGCSSDDDRPRFDGQVYRAKLQRIDGQFDTFQVTVRDVSRSIDGAKEAGRYEAIDYCVNNFGSSDIAWTVGPDTPNEGLVIEGDTLVFQGKCTY